MLCRPRICALAAATLLFAFGPVAGVAHADALPAADKEDTAVQREMRRLTDQDPAVRQQAATALGQLGSQAGPAVAALKKALHDRDKGVRAAARAASKRIGKDQTLRQSEDAAKPVEEPAIEAVPLNKLGHGTGSGGGRGTGEGTGTGAGVGRANLTERQKRILRWTVVFDTQNGKDYLRQLQGLGALLAAPLPEGGWQLYADLKNPKAHKKVTSEDLGKINQIFWVDDRKSSVAALARALGIKEPPPHVVAFFPEKLEKELLQKERKYRGRKEDEIKDTKFKVIQRGGKYEVEVTGQTLK